MARLIYLFCILLSLVGCSQNSVKTVQVTLDKQISADTYYAQEQCDKAVPLYKSLSITMPKDTKSLLRIGNCYARAQDFTQAQEAYQQALIRDNSFVKAWYNLTYVRAQLLASTVTEMYKHIDPASPEVAKIRNLTLQVLAPFDIKLDSVSEVQE
ncbi:MAG: tetratricopeptide (TPR) repeat protein [Methylophagaceae bacterium]|jgi:tetratricopeptide (TPR) repeat protein